MEIAQGASYMPTLGNFGASRNADCGHASPPSTAIESPSLIRDGIGRTEDLLGNIHEALDVLERRLDTVLQPTPPLGATTAAANKLLPSGSHLHGRVSSLNDGFDSVVQRLRSITQRVEV